MRRQTDTEKIEVVEELINDFGFKYKLDICVDNMINNNITINVKNITTMFKKEFDKQLSKNEFLMFFIVDKMIVNTRKVS